MKRLFVFVLFAATVAAVPAGAMVRGLPGGPNAPQPLVTFPAGAFPESLAVRGDSLYASLGFLGEVVKLTPGIGGAASETYAAVPRGDGLLTGLAFDGAGNLFVAAATFSADPAPGVFEIPAGGGTAVRVLTLPAESFPNGLAFRDGYVYVSDSSRGAIWRFQPTGTNAMPSEPWHEDSLLAPVRGIGANGIAFDASGSHLFLVVADSGRLVRLTLGDGGVTATDLVVEHEQLRSADGIAFDANGDLYISVNDTNRLYRLSLTALSLTRLADRSDGLSYPTQPAFDTTPSATTLYLTNGALMNGVADLEVFNVGIGGLPLQ